MRRHSIPKEYRPILKRLKGQGWTIEVTGGKHLVWLGPDGQKVYSAATPKSPETHKIRADLRRAGADL